MSDSIQSQDYYLIDDVVADGDIPIKIYANKITGLKVVIAYVESPIVKSDIVFATEAFDDDGLPHTLEHLVFLGSESYPYKGVLDLVANKCFSDGTNAWTDTDHTNYTLSCAGKDGYLTLLPIYLDHLIFPTLTDEAYITEVHHINGEAENAGVVYCEMQATENTGDTVCCREMLRSLYPGHCGYKSVTGGLLENLRTSTSNEKVRQYHKDFYHSKNMCLIATGPIKAEEVFKAIKPIEDKIVSRGLHLKEFKRPWQTPVEALQSSSKMTIEYQSDTDDNGIVYIGYRGPNLSTNFNDMLSLALILDYLNNTAISPIQLEFVESEDPICSSVYHSAIESSTCCFYIVFESVSRKYLNYTIIDKLNEVLLSIVEKKKKFDIERLRTIISRRIVQILSSAESSPHGVILGSVIGHFLYGHDSLSDRCCEIQTLEKLLKMEDQFWLDLIFRYMLDNNSARYSLVVGEPSPEKLEELSTREKERLRKQRESLACQLSSLNEKLESAKSINGAPPPDEIISSFPVPSTSNIVYHPIERVVHDWDVPIRVQYDNIKTNFITQTVLLDTSHCLTQKQRFYLPLLSELIFECPVIRNGKEISYETVIEQLYSDTVTYSAGTGLGSVSVFTTGTFSMLFLICFQVEISKQQKIIDWLIDILHNSVFTIERIKTITTRMLSDISQLKRSGSKMVSSVSNTIMSKPDSNCWTSNFMRQQTFLKKILNELQKEPVKVQEELVRIRDLLAKPKNMLIHLTFDKNKIDLEPFFKAYRGSFPPQLIESNKGRGQIELENIIPCHRLVNFSPNLKQALIGLGSSDSKYMRQIVPAMSDFNHEDIAPLYVLSQYLTQLEGPLFREVRGIGLAYHVNISLNLSQDHTKPDAEFNEQLFKSAKSSLIYEFIRKEKSPSDRSLQSLICYLRNLPLEYNKNLIEKIEKVTIEDMLRVGPKYLRPLFESDMRLTVMSCPKSEANKLRKRLLEVGCGDLKILSIENDSDFLSAI